MAGSAEQKLQLIIAAQTDKAEAGLRRVREQFAGMRAPIGHAEKAASGLHGRIAKLRAEHAMHFRTMEQGEAIAGRLMSRITGLVGAYVSWRVASAIIGGIVAAAKDAETSHFNLAASVQSASREFEDTGSLDHWQGKVRELSAALKIYSEADVANAISRTVDMTKRLGLSAVQMEELIRRSADLSAGKTDLQGGIERVTAALRGEAEASEFLGLTLNETYIKSWHDAHNAHGNAWKDLTDLERAQVRYNVFLEQSDGMQGRAAKSAGTFSGALAMVKSEMANAVANNRNLEQAMTGLAESIRGNAASLGDLAAMIANAIGSTVTFVAENKNLILALAGAGGLLWAVNKTVSALTVLNGTIGMIRKAQLASVATEAAGGLGQMAASAAVARAGLIGLTVAVAALASGKVIELIQTIREWREAAADADAAQQRLMTTTAENVAKFEAWKDVRLPGLDGADIETLERYRSELAKSSAYWTALHAELSQRSEATDFLGRMTEDAREAAAQLPEVTARLQQIRADLSQVNAALNTTEETTLSMDEALAKVAQATEDYRQKQDLLTGALAAQAVTEENLQAKVAELGEAYYRAALAAKEMESAGGEGHQKALEEKLKAEAAYAKAVQALREHQWKQSEEAYSSEESRLRRSLDTRLLDLDRYLQLEVITQAEYTHKKAQAEEELAAEIARLRAEAAADAAEIYGEDSREYRQAVEEKIDAEHALQQAVAVTKAKWREMMGLAQSGRESAGRLASSLDSVGAAGERGGAQAADGLRRVREAAEESADSVDRLAESVESAATGGRKPGGRSGGASAWFYESWSQITNQINELKSLQELMEFSGRQGGYLQGTTSGAHDSMRLNTILSRRMQSEMARRWQELEADAAAQIAAATQAAQEKTIQGVAGSGAGPRGAARTVQVQFRAPNGQAVTGQFDDDSSTSRLLEVLRQSGAVTA